MYFMLFCSVVTCIPNEWNYVTTSVAGVWHELFITTVLPSTAVFFHGTYRGAKSVVPRNTNVKCCLFYCDLELWPSDPNCELFISVPQCINAVSLVKSITFFSRYHDVNNAEDAYTDAWTHKQNENIATPITIMTQEYNSDKLYW